MANEIIRFLYRRSALAKRPPPALMPRKQKRAVRFFSTPLSVSHSLTITHGFDTASGFAHAIVCEHAFINTNMRGGIEHLVNVRHDFVRPNGTLASGRYRR